MSDGVPEVLRGLVGHWAGRGDGTWASSGPFSFEEEMTFEDGGGGPDFPFLAYAEHAWDPESSTAFHRERGFWIGDGRAVQVALAHPIGVTEIAEGTIDGGAIELSATRLEHTPGGLVVTAYRRRYTLSGETLGYEQFLATEPGQDPVRHVWAELTRG